MSLKYTLIVALSIIFLMLVLFIFFVSKKPKEKKNKYGEDLKLINSISENKRPLVEVENLEDKSRRFDKLFEKLKSKYHLDPNDLEENISEEDKSNLKEISDVRKYLMESISSISMRRKEISREISISNKSSDSDDDIFDMV